MTPGVEDDATTDEELKSCAYGWTGSKWITMGVVLLAALGMLLFRGPKGLLLLFLATLPVILLLIIITAQHKDDLSATAVTEFFWTGATISILCASLLELFAQLTTRPIWRCQKSPDWTLRCDVFFVFVVVLAVGLSEELSKFIPLQRVRIRPRHVPRNCSKWFRVIDTPYGVFIAGCASAAGFACIENIKYTVSVGMDDLQLGIDTSLFRGLLAIPFHVACTGYIAAKYAGHFFCTPEVLQAKTPSHTGAMAWLGRLFGAKPSAVQSEDNLVPAPWRTLRSIQTRPNHGLRSVGWWAGALEPESRVWPRAGGPDPSYSGVIKFEDEMFKSETPQGGGGGGSKRVARRMASATGRKRTVEWGAHQKPGGPGIGEAEDDDPEEREAPTPTGGYSQLSDGNDDSSVRAPSKLKSKKDVRMDVPEITSRKSPTQGRCLESLASMAPQPPPPFSETETAHEMFSEASKFVVKPLSLKNMIAMLSFPVLLHGLYDLGLFGAAQFINTSKSEMSQIVSPLHQVAVNGPNGSWIFSSAEAWNYGLRFPRLTSALRLTEIAGHVSSPVLHSLSRRLSESTCKVSSSSAAGRRLAGGEEVRGGDQYHHGHPNSLITKWMVPSNPIYGSGQKKGMWAVVDGEYRKPPEESAQMLMDQMHRRTGDFYSNLAILAVVTSLVAYVAMILLWIWEWHRLIKFQVNAVPKFALLDDLGGGQEWFKDVHQRLGLMAYDRFSTGGLWSQVTPVRIDEEVGSELLLLPNQLLDTGEVGLG